MDATAESPLKNQYIAYLQKYKKPPDNADELNAFCIKAGIAVSWKECNQFLRDSPILVDQIDVLDNTINPHDVQGSRENTNTSELSCEVERERLKLNLEENVKSKPSGMFPTHFQHFLIL